MAIQGINNKLINSWTKTSKTEIERLAETLARIYQITWRHIPETYNLDFLTVENKELGVFTGRRFRLLGRRIGQHFSPLKNCCSWPWVSGMYQTLVWFKSLVQLCSLSVSRPSLVSSCHQEPLEILLHGHSQLQSAIWIVTFTFAVLS